MEDEEAQLLAELRAISNQSAASRFDAPAADAVDESSAAAGAVDDTRAATTSKEEAPLRSKSNVRKTAGTPPWKKKKAVATTAASYDDVVVVAAPPQKATTISSAKPDESQGYGIKSNLPSTFQGDRGGDANDPELLALLRGVSNQGPDRFADDANEKSEEEVVPVTDEEAVVVENAPAAPPAERRTTPPWKKKKQPDGPKPWDQKRRPPAHENVIVVAAPRLTAANIEEEDAIIDENMLRVANKHLQPDETQGYGIKPDLRSTFRGDRGGDANDPELLALLRGVSNKGPDRFADDNAVVETKRPMNEIAEKEPVMEIELVGEDKASPEPPAEAQPAESRVTPPWKKKKEPHGPTPRQQRASQSTNSNDIVVVAVPTKDESHGYGIKSDLPSTFQGDRGGSAEDPELLALLRGVSNRESDRFAEKIAQPAAAPVTRAAEPKPTKDEVNLRLTDIPLSNESQGYGIKPDLPSTFRGERGGAAEDAELLALLRGVSSKGVDRFAEEDATPPSQPVVMMTVPQNPVPVASAAPAMAETAHAPGPVAPEVTIENLSDALKDMNWKVRCQGYEKLGSLVRKMADGQSDVGLVRADDVLQGLDDQLPSMMEETNASALDKALEFALLYADHCQSASSSKQAARIVSALIKKNGLSSRPSTTKLATALILKLMEVGTTGSDSVHAVVDALLADGLTSRKPKVVASSVSLLVQSIDEFGAVTLPLASIISSAPKILAHTSASVRENGLIIVAEICRAVGSKAPLQSVIDGMKAVQVSELDKLLSNRETPKAPKVQLRSADTHGSSPTEALAALEAGAKELEAERYAARPPVDLIERIRQTDYISRLGLSKWSERVGGMTTIIECAGEKPYKLAQPSPSVSYAQLVKEMKLQLGHTHFAVNSKAMEVLSMLAEGVGEKLYPLLRPILPTLLSMSKDKKLTKAVASCLDSLFGQVLGFEHLLDDDAIWAAVDEKKQKNALARTSALDFVGRCIKRSNSAEPRASMSSFAVTGLAKLAATKLNDSDASVRKAATDIFALLKDLEDSEYADIVNQAVETLKTEHSRAYKTLMRNQRAPVAPPQAAISSRMKPASPEKAPLSSASTAKTSDYAPSVQSEAKSPPVGASRPNKLGATEPSLERALEIVAAMSIPQWHADEGDGGIRAGLAASKWLLRQEAIKSLTAHVESGSLPQHTEAVTTNASAILVVVREHTRGFKETNVNIMKSIIDLFEAVCAYHDAAEVVLPTWASQEGAQLAVQKISDRKLMKSANTLLTTLCTVGSPSDVILCAFSALEKVKSPIAHEEFAVWFRGFCDDFGLSYLTPYMSEVTSWLVTETSQSNTKAKRAVFALAGHLHRIAGAPFRALILSLAKKPELKAELEICMEANEHDPSLAKRDFPQRSLAGVAASSALDGDAGMPMTLPIFDLFGDLPHDILPNLSSKEGKAAWKHRKAALEELDVALHRCSGLLDVSDMKRHIELMRGLRDRLSDTQINLKPIAAQVIAKVLGVVGKTTQAKLGKIVFGPLINAGMNDIKKPMRTACLDALRAGMTLSPLEGAGVNEEAVEPLVSALVGEVTETSTRAGGLSEILDLFEEITNRFPNLDEIASTRGQTLGEKYASVLVECLTSSKSETRASTTSLLEASISYGVISPEGIRRATEKLKPAKQRSVGPTIAKLTKKTPVAGAVAEIPLRVSNKPVPQRPVPAPTSKIQSPSTPLKGPAGRSSRLQAFSPAPSSKNPLVGRPGKCAVSVQPISWPEFPEEPSGSPLFAALKKSWSTFLPQTSISVFFPMAGVRKQDDAKAGCELLRKALEIDRAENSEFTIDQLDFALKWIAFVLCSRETTVGLQAVLDLVVDLLTFLVERSYELSDSDVGTLIVLILEKGTLAKGRFRDAYEEVNQLLIMNESLLPAKRLGSIACACIIDSSHHVKSRVAACKLAVACIEKAGLAGVGKKAVVGAAKFLSESLTHADQKHAALDLLSMILNRMNGDMHRLFRICGTNLTEKARSELESFVGGGVAPFVSSIPATSRHPTKTPASTARKRRGAVARGRDDRVFEDLPAFKLRDQMQTTGATPSSDPTDIRESTPDDPFAFSLRSRITEATTPMAERSRPEEAAEDNESLGAAASLRARLMKIREKSTVSDDSVASGSAKNDQSFVAEAEFENCLLSITRLIEKPCPIDESDTDLVACIEYSKKIHAVLSRQPAGTFGIPAEGFGAIRSLIEQNMTRVLEHFTGLIGFSFDCSDVAVSAGMSIPLLSVCLASLMALFRDDALAALVGEGDMTLLIRETGTALLDSRLSGGGLDEATSSQMVRAINKLAVQAATSAPRHVTFMALMTLRQQLSLEVLEVSDDVFSCRLGRVVSKLFARVIKAEEASEQPFGGLDMEVLICSMDDVLMACEDQDGTQDCVDMIRSLVDAIAKAQGGPRMLLDLMNALGIEIKSSPLGEMLLSMEDMGEGDPRDAPAADIPRTIVQALKRPSVAELVADVANAPAGPARVAAVDSLKRYNAEQGPNEYHAHLSQVSTPFRSFIESQLEEEKGSMSDRLQSLRSRLHTMTVDQNSTTQVSKTRTTVSTTRIPTPDKASPSKSRAAALRARLEAVKQQSALR